MNNPQINRLEGSESGTIVIGKNQTLLITGMVVGETKVSIGEVNSDTSSMPELNSHIYIDAKNSVEDSFLMWPYMNNKRIQLFLEEGKWYAKVGETVITIESISIENKEGNTTENFKELPVNVTLTDNEGELNQIPMEISCNGVPMTREEDKGSYSYKTSDNTLEVFLPIVLMEKMF